MVLRVGAELWAFKVKLTARPGLDDPEAPQHCRPDLGDL